MLYQYYELTHAMISPMRHLAEWGLGASNNPINPMRDTPLARLGAAQLEMFINATRRYAKPEFGIDVVEVDGKEVLIRERKVHRKPFCDLIHFERVGVSQLGQKVKSGAKGKSKASSDPAVLIISPMSGHYATLLRGTVRQMLQDHEVYITDWIDAREVPRSSGPFDLDDYVDYLREQLQFLHERHGERAHLLAVCQPGVPALVAASLMAEDEDPARPASLSMMGSPIDVSINPKKPNELAESRPLSWFQANVIMNVPFPHKGFMRRVYPGFLQLQGFWSMNHDRHTNAHIDYFYDLVTGDGESAEAHRAFYDEYLAVMDMTEEFYLQTIDRVFQKRLLAEGKYEFRGRKVDPGAIKDIALFTIEGERDDITGIGQTEAAHGLTTNLPKAKRKHLLQKGVGHYGVFNGSRWRTQIYPKLAKFIAAHHVAGA